MRAAIAILLLFPLLASAEEEKKKPKDPVKELPGCLQPGAKATYVRASGGDRLKGTVTFAVEKGEADGTVRLIREYATDKSGPLAMRDRLMAVLDATTRRVVSFKYEIGKEKDKPLFTASRLKPHPKKKGSLLHERLTYREKGKDPSIRKTRITIEGLWAPDLLEPFLVPLLTVSSDEDRKIGHIKVLTGTVSRKPPAYRALGNGKLGKNKVPCRILSRLRDGKTTTLYLRSSDALPLKGGAFFLEVATEGGK
jgi:hypothetical protein